MPKQPQPPHLQPSIAENLWWVLPDQLAGVRKPIEGELSALREAGIGAVISIMSDDEVLELYKRQNFPYLWVPILGGTAPTRSQLQQIKTFVESQNALGNAVAVHCSSGRRRTGTVLAALLMQQGSDYESAIATIHAANPAVELREAQISFLQNLEQNLEELGDL